MDLKPDEIYARLYDASVPDRPGEIDFYLKLARQAKDQGQAVLEVACGTGRVGLRLAQAGAQVTGVEIPAPMLEIARMKSQAKNVSWVEGDMRDFDLNQQFGLVIVPGYSFQFMLTEMDQLRCLENIKRHLTADGRLVVHLDHQDMDWLGSLVSGKGGIFHDKGVKPGAAKWRPHPHLASLVVPAYGSDREVVMLFGSRSMTRIKCCRPGGRLR